MPAFAKAHGTQIAGSRKRWLGWPRDFAAVLALVLAIVFAAICLAYSVPLRAYVGRIFARITGDRQSGEHYMEIISATVKSVANGVIGVAFVQALLGRHRFLRGWNAWGGAVVASRDGARRGADPSRADHSARDHWAFAVKSTTVAIIFTVWSIIAGLSDAVLKPLMIGHGLEVPMPIILLGVIGGVMAFGLVGLFIGAVVLAVGYVLFSDWVGTIRD